MNQVIQVRAIEKLSRSIDLSIKLILLSFIMSALRSMLSLSYIPSPPRKLERHLEPTDIRSEDYLNRAANHLSKAYSLYFNDIEDEACEEAWRATVEALNVLSTAFWRRRIISHKGLGIFVDWLYEEAIVDIRVEYSNATSLHAHYYQLDYLSRSTIYANIQQVDRLISKIKDIYFRSISELSNYLGVIPIKLPVPVLGNF